MSESVYRLPFVKWISARPDTLRQDLVAGITVSLVAIPQSLAYAQLAGVPAYYGLYAALIPSIVGALFGSSRQLSTGPVAMTSLLTAASVAPLAARGTEVFYAYVIMLALVSGLFQVMFGVFRMGALLNFLSHPVLMGFINAAAIIIGLSQLPTLLGISARQSEHFLLDIGQVLGNLDVMHGTSVVFGVTAIVLLIVLKKMAPEAAERADHRGPADLGKLSGRICGNGRKGRRTGAAGTADLRHPGHGLERRDIAFCPRPSLSRSSASWKRCPAQRSSPSRPRALGREQGADRSGAGQGCRGFQPFHACQRFVLPFSLES